MQSLHPLTIFHGQFSGGFGRYFITTLFRKIYTVSRDHKQSLGASHFSLCARFSQNCLSWKLNASPHFFTATYNADCEDPYPSLSDFHDYEPNLEFDDSDLLQQKHPENDDGEYSTVTQSEVTFLPPEGKPRLACVSRFLTNFFSS